MSEARSYGRGARLLPIGIASTGLLTFLYFAIASHVLDDEPYGRISTLWAVMFLIVTAMYRPIEMLVSREIASGRGRGVSRVALIIQAAFAIVFLVVALLLRRPIEDGLFGGEAVLYWILVAGVLCYAASYFARGWLAGHGLFVLYAGLVFMEAASRLMFAFAVAVGLMTGQNAVALGIAAAPLVSLAVVPWALSRTARDQQSPDAAPAIPISRGGRFALAILVVMLAEQALLNGAVVTVAAAGADLAAAGLVFNVLLVARVPLQLFQAIQVSLLHHLAAQPASVEGRAEFTRAVRSTVLAISAFALVAAVGLFAIGPWAMALLFEAPHTYSGAGLALVAFGAGAHLIAGTLNQAALTRERATAVAVAWLASAGLFVLWMLASVIDDEILRAEVGYFGAATLLCGLMCAIYLRGPSGRPTARGDRPPSHGWRRSAGAGAGGG